MPSGNLERKSAGERKVSEDDNAFRGKIPQCQSLELQGKSFFDSFEGLYLVRVVKEVWEAESGTF